MRRSKGTLQYYRRDFYSALTVTPKANIHYSPPHFSFGHNSPLPLCCAIEPVDPFYAAYALFVNICPVRFCVKPAEQDSS